MTAASPHEVLTLHGDRGEEVGWLVIDSLVGGMSFGGFRFSPSVTREEVDDPQKLRIETQVSGERLQSSSTAEMIFGVAEIIAFASRLMTLEPGDVILQSDPYECGGAISHINDWMVMVPIFFDGELVGFTSMFGHMMDVGGWVPGSMPTCETT